MSWIQGLIKGKDVIKETFAGITSIIDESFTSKEEKAQAHLLMNQLQTNINLVEASSKSLFVSGWRPFVGWVCGGGVGMNYIIRPCMNFILTLIDRTLPQMESLDMTTMLPLLTGMLGFGALRTYEKIKGKSRS